MTERDHTTYAEKLKRGGNCTAITDKDLPCPIHGDRLVDGHWYCHVHDPNGVCQQNLRRVERYQQRTPDVKGQMRFSDLLNDENRGLALFHPPDDTQGRIASKRIKKWNPPTQEN